MTGLLTILVLLGITIAIWQMVKIFDLAQVNKDVSQVANDKDNRVNGYLMLAFLGFIYGITIVSFALWGDLPLTSNSASEHGPEIDRLMIISMVVIFIVQTITQFLLHYFAFKYKGEKGRKALFYADNDKLEFIWTVIPVIVLAGLIMYGLFTWTDIMNVDEDDDPLVVELYAQQFNWKARYAGEDNVLGKANVRLINLNNANILGLDESDPNAQDDVITTELHLPVGRPVLFKMRSQDVLHSAYMPHFRAQMNCVPGMITQFSFTPTVTTEEMRLNPDIYEKVKNINRIRVNKSKKLQAKGEEPLDRYEFDYLLLCNKICGKSHYNMQMKIIVESEEDYNEWLKEQKLFKNSLVQN
ncbi:cytochrome c oxidase subunit II [Flavobacteriaceae bacterium]|jgi:cytochrome c oxidase subunit 2|nr:cytochrome c oxidase subunit II [bacterium]MDA8847447.1 cytochrome c oxidase subunit II [Flavobacteriaceae bacterium]MDA9002627.1 cytochrome c oxidase subunit II [Flavobacteriaceae bacterium]MDA9029884.1 cytochrome c oxidase subunit II [Flavobacteriaceae bacterium]|tara:strand:- start:7385 stop:8455 length:1071 start_codon:yes stop_codon:yes gene_type:complete